MVASALYVFDASPLVAGCQFKVDGESVISKAIARVEVHIPSGVYEEVVTRGETRPDALEAARLVQEGLIRLVAPIPGEAVGSRYPRGFIPHSLALLESLTS